MGTKPTNPELLDFLAADFVANGWSVKKLQREILLSATYRQSSAPRADVDKADPGNKLLAVFPRQRLEAEEVRDSLLAAAGLLEDKVGGPAVFPPIPVNMDNRNAWVTSDNPHDHNRRSVYVFVRRNTPYPLLETFDWANPQLVHNKREVTTTAPQALALVNSDLVFAWSKALAARVMKEAGNGDGARLDRVFEILYARKPDAFERGKLLAFLDSQQAIAQKTLAAGKTVNTPEGFGVDPTVAAQIDRLYKAAYGRAPDRFEKASFVQFVDQQKAKAAKVLDADAEDSTDDTGARAAKKPLDVRETARASAFVDLVHALANANDFLYRF
jgi:hypothetical protein